MYLLLVYYINEARKVLRRSIKPLVSSVASDYYYDQMPTGLNYVILR